ncbi:hypothetical protein CEXT_698781 [Caerostris extrusa]|uniref:Uncharacterized protein n=1 Tax=Caerostris extrusa TaxID=172846 RepID=A0AAV4PSP6_CAEEX|nr:hypothetical protein CEXT_698781 [Caerostris extrusa]
MFGEGFESILKMEDLPLWLINWRGGYPNLPYSFLPKNSFHAYSLSFPTGYCSPNCSDVIKNNVLIIYLSCSLSNRSRYVVGHRIPPLGPRTDVPLLLSLSNAQHVPLETAGRGEVWLGNTEQERRETIVLPWQVLIAQSHAALTDSFTESVYFATFFGLHCFANGWAGFPQHRFSGFGLYFRQLVAY